MNCYYVFSQHNCENKNDPWWIVSYYYSPIYRSCGELFLVTKEVPSMIPGNIYCRIKQTIFCHNNIYCPAYKSFTCLRHLS